MGGSSSKKTMVATWNGVVIAQSDNTSQVEGNYYFPRNDVKEEYLVKSSHSSICFWKGYAKYYSIKVKNDVNTNAAWYYPYPSPLALNINNKIAFWNGVRITQLQTKKN